MNVISFVDIAELNGILREKQLPFRIHIKDACGKQSCWIEPLSGCYCDGHYEDVYEVLETYFGKLRYELEYSESKMDFWLKN